MDKTFPRKDERDILFARASYGEGTHMHEHYYKKNPEKLEFDSEVRARGIMGGDDAAMFNELISPIPNAAFEFLADIKALSSGSPSEKKVEGDAVTFTEVITGLAKYYGARGVAITKLKDYNYYSHKGRPAQEYGKEIVPSYKYGICFYVEMEEDLIDTAPSVTQSVAVTKGYVDAAIIGMVLAYYIRSLGYEARNNMDGNYLFPLPRVFEQAGLGDVGMSGLLVTKEFGSRIRLGMVSTNIPLIESAVERPYIADFCKLCSRCKRTCPPQAIKDETSGFEDETCLSMWMHFGSDCGLCMASCPFSHNLPKELTADISTHEARVKLAKYCSEKFGHFTTNKQYPDWLNAAY